MSLYRQIFGQAWKMAWKNKFLWFFGLFAALLGSGEYDFLIRFIIGDSDRGFFLDWRMIAQTGVFSVDTLGNMRELLDKDPLSLFLATFVFLVVIILSLFVVWISIVSLVAIVHNSALSFQLKRADFNTGLDAGTKKFWPVFFFNVIVRLAIYLFFAIIAFFFGVAGDESAGLGWIAYVIAFILFMPLAIIASFIVKYSIAYVVIKDKKFFNALKKGWQLFSNNWLVSIETAFILFLINLTVGLLVVLLILSLLIPFVLLIQIAKLYAATFAFWSVTTIALGVFLSVIALAGSWLAVFQIAAWTKLFLELEEGGVSSKIIRTVNRMLEK